MDILEKSYKLGNSKNQKSSQVTPASSLVGEDGSHHFPTQLGHLTKTMVYEISQTPFGDSYSLGASEKISLMLMKSPTITLLEETGVYEITGCTLENSRTIQVRDPDLAKRTLRDFMQAGTKIDLPVGDYVTKSTEWKNSFGGYFLPLNFSRGSPTGRGPSLPFDPKDMAYLKPEGPGPSYMNASREVRIALLRGYIDRYGVSGGSSLGPDIIEVRSSSLAVLEVVRQIAKGLGYLAGPLDQPQTYGVLISASILGRPVNAYPIEVKPLGEFETFITPGECKVVFNDGTVGWW